MPLTRFPVPVGTCVVPTHTNTRTPYFFASYRLKLAVSYQILNRDPAVIDFFSLNTFTRQPPFHDRVEGGVELGVGAYPEERMFVLDIPKTGATPTAPIAAAGNAAAAADRHKRVHLAPNPAWLRVNEVTIGVSSTDTLFDLSGEEVSAGGQGTNRLARLAGHLLQQQSFYPLFPPPAGSAAQLDMRHAQRWGMPSTPDVLLVPSRLAQFAREVQVRTAVSLSFFFFFCARAPFTLLITISCYV